MRVGYERGQLEILPCKYQFTCRQFVMDDSKRPKYFEFTGTPHANAVKLETSASANIAVVSILNRKQHVKNNISDSNVE